MWSVRDKEEGEGCVAYLTFVLQMSRDGCCSSSREARGRKPSLTYWDEPE